MNCSYEFRFCPTAYDKRRINQKLTDHVEIRYPEAEKHPGDLLLWTKADAESPQDALMKSISYLDEFFDFYCAIKGVALSIAPSDEIDLLKPNLPIKKHPVYGLITSKSYSLSRKEGKYIYDSTKKFRAKKFRFLTFAMKYYRKAKLAEHISDKLINYFIALESLYSDEGTEITFRFSTRMALLLGKRSNTRKKLVKMGKKMYSYRSKVVHGVEIELDEKAIKEVDMWVRNSILSFIGLLRKYKNRKEILRRIDDSMVEEKIRMKLQKQANLLVFNYF